MSSLDQSLEPRFDRWGVELSRPPRPDDAGTRPRRRSRTRAVRGMAPIALFAAAAAALVVHLANI